MLAAQRGYSILALLLAAQLSIAVHAAEHGSGQHTHENVVCEFGAINDDDIVVAPLLTSLPAEWRDVAPSPATAVCRYPDRVYLTPPATGPPHSA